MRIVCWQAFLRAKRGRCRCRRRGDESNRGKRKTKRVGQARRQICEIAGRCMKTIWPRVKHGLNTVWFAGKLFYETGTAHGFE